VVSKASESRIAPPCTVSNPRSGLGYYSARPVDGLRVIALKSVILGREYHEADGVSQEDAGDAQLDWLAGELADAEGNEKVLLAMHIPPGSDAYAVSHESAETSMWTRDPQAANSPGEGAGAPAAASPEAPAEAATETAEEPAPPPAEDWLDRFLDLMAAHRDTVVGLAYGHTHLDELRVCLFALAVAAVPGLRAQAGSGLQVRTLGVIEGARLGLEGRTELPSERSGAGRGSLRLPGSAGVQPLRGERPRRPGPHPSTDRPRSW